jgi:hypothetical protein
LWGQSRRHALRFHLIERPKHSSRGLADYGVRFNLDEHIHTLVPLADCNLGATRIEWKTKFADVWLDTLREKLR